MPKPHQQNDPYSDEALGISEQDEKIEGFNFSSDQFKEKIVPFTQTTDEQGRTARVSFAVPPAVVKRINKFLVDMRMGDDSALVPYNDIADVARDGLYKWLRLLVDYYQPEVAKRDSTFDILSAAQSRIDRERGNQILDDSLGAISVVLAEVLAAGQLDGGAKSMADWVSIIDKAEAHGDTFWAWKWRMGLGRNQYVRRFITRMENEGKGDDPVVKVLAGYVEQYEQHHRE